jgi:WhiB family redox-sensing transcriptional regulator
MSQPPLALSTALTKRRALDEPVTDWRQDAACREAAPELFFTDNSDEAKAICADCPVRAECLSWALENTEFGVWGGLGEDERQAQKPAAPVDWSAELKTCRRHAEALRVAWRAIGVTGMPTIADVPPAVTWLARHSWTIPHRTAHGVHSRIADRTAQLPEPDQVVIERLVDRLLCGDRVDSGSTTVTSGWRSGCHTFGRAVRSGTVIMTMSRCGKRTVLGERS